MSVKRFVIIGNGPAANHAAEALREKSSESKITMFSKDPFRSYRAHLLPDFIAGLIEEEDLYNRPYAHYNEMDITLRLGQRVVNVDFSKRNVILDHKEVVPFDGLIIATGGKPRIPELFQLFGDIMMTLKTPSDARLWIQKLSYVDSVLIIGGDLTSLSLTKALLKLGKRVKFILNEDAFWPVPLNEEIYRAVTGRLEQRGIEIVHCRRIRRITQLEENLLEVETDSELIEVGALGAFFGLVPDVGFLARTGLDIDRGVLVNEFLKTRFSNVYAAGDCAQVYHPVLRDYWISIGHENAIALGRIAASNLAGSHLEVQVEPENILEVGGVKVNTSWWTEF
ncbi:MAG: FAD/NAD(P)-binding oxidoreductase [Deltaproteobacteria bacterium]|nr:FAD/NAD(P)-binding oxidoreductase [Deltaproteobacteria bacterium]